MANYVIQIKKGAGLGKKYLKCKSGQFNVTDAITMPCELSWLNGFYHVAKGKTRRVYHELCLSVGIVGKLANIYHMQDPVLRKATSLQSRLFAMYVKTPCMK